MKAGQHRSADTDTDTHIGLNPKKPGFFRKMSESRVEAGKIPAKLRISY